MLVIMGDTVEEVKDTVEEVKDEVKQAAKKVTDSDTYLGSDDEKENRDNQAGGKDPMNPEDLAKHEPTAVKRDKNQGRSGDPV
jgi:Sec-independent protein translocase protein TatA